MQTEYNRQQKRQRLLREIGYFMQQCEKYLDQA